MLNATGWWLAVAPVDLRCGIDRLLVLVQALRGGAPIDDGAYVFRNRSGSRLKVVCADGHGVWLCVRRLHEGKFHWPGVGAERMALTREQFAWLVAGANWERLSRRVEGLARAL
jgi:transposase